MKTSSTTRADLTCGQNGCNNKFATFANFRYHLLVYERVTRNNPVQRDVQVSPVIPVQPAAQPNPVLPNNDEFFVNERVFQQNVDITKGNSKTNGFCY